MRAFSAAAAIVALGVLAASCAGVPAHTEVHVGDSAPAAPRGRAPRVIPPRPYPGQSPKKVVEGFLDASASFADNDAAARLFLTSAAATHWKPQQAGVVVYDGGSSGSAPPPVLTPRASHGRARVSVSATRQATIGADGAYHVAPGQLDAHLRLTKTPDGWRISSLPAHLLLTDLDVGLSFQPLDVYFLSRSGRFVVPDRVYLHTPQATGGTPTALVRALLGGPSTWLSKGVRTAVPSGTTLLGNVPVDGHGLAQVDLSAEARSASAASQRQLAAQIVYTLRQLTSVVRVQITADGSALPAVPDTIEVGDYDDYDSGTVSAKLRYVYTAEHRLRTANGRPVSGALGRDDRGLHDVAISPNGRHVAGIVGTGGEGLLVSTVGGESRTIAVEADHLTPPSFGRSGRVFTVATEGGDQQVYAVARNGEVLAVGAHALLSRGTVSQLSISPDGARAVAVVGGKVLMGQVTGRPARPVLTHFRSVQPDDYEHAGNLAWSAADEVVALMRPVGATGHAQQTVPVSISVDGAEVTAGTVANLPGPPRQIAAAPNEDELVVARGKGKAKIFSLAGSGWRLAATGSSPAYPG